MEELQTELDKKISIREGYLLIARNEESLNDEIRELQMKIRELKA